MAGIGKIEFIDEVAKKANLSNEATFRFTLEPRKGRNVQSGEEVKIPAHKKVKFTPGKKLTETVYKKK